MRRASSAWRAGSCSVRGGAILDRLAGAGVRRQRASRCRRSARLTRVRALPLSVSFDLALLVNSLPRLAFGWALMVIAMMLPLAIAPLRHVRERSFARRRTRSMLLFVAGFVALWMAAGVVLRTARVADGWSGAVSARRSGLRSPSRFVWQVSPAKQWCLNRCHQRPPLSAFGFAADADAVRFGVKNGAACAGACWALMLPMLLIGQGQLCGDDRGDAVQRRGKPGKAGAARLALARRRQGAAHPRGVAGGADLLFT